MELLGTLIWVTGRTNGRTNKRTDSLLELAGFYPAAKNPEGGPKVKVMKSFISQTTSVNFSTYFDKCTLSIQGIHKTLWNLGY